AVSRAGTRDYDYDSAGNMIAVRNGGRIIRSLVWNTEGQLTRIDDAQVGRIINRYDADGLRVQQVSRQGISDHYGRLADWTATTGLTKYIYAGSLLVARHHAGERLWYTLDRLGSPRLLTGEAGPVSYLNYAPYGQTTSRTGSTD